MLAEKHFPVALSGDFTPLPVRAARTGPLGHDVEKSSFCFTGVMFQE